MVLLKEQSIKVSMVLLKEQSIKVSMVLKVFLRLELGFEL